MKPVFQRSYEKKKEFIAQIGSTIFYEKGYKESSLADIAKKANVSKAGIFHYFKTKEDMLSYCLMEKTDKFINALKSCIRQNEENKSTPEEAFRNLAIEYARNLNRVKGHSLLVLRERHQLTGKNKIDLYKKEQELFHLLKNELKKIRKVNGRYNLNVISFLVISMSHWMGYWFKGNGNLSKDEVISQNIDIIFHGMLKN